ncbi:MAG TPA: phosphoglycerate kinase [Candidatus Scybalousia intestinigallinarum]|nr:phosphoglycerate kinase [Candidatus Scybalousia intestinigallinarum]
MKRTITDLNLTGKRVIIRCDFNVPMKNGEIADDTRIVESLDTIRYAVSQKAKVILMSHLGRIKEESDKAKNSLAPVAERLSELLHHPVLFINKTRSDTLIKTVEEMKEGDILLIENTRFEDLEGKKESSNDDELATYWANLGDIFINDAFGTIHRSHASNVGIGSRLPNAIGFLVEKELKALSRLDNPERPYVVILGGSKVSDKIGVIKNLIEKADKIIIGGGMAFTFLKAAGYSIGSSILDEENIDFCKQMLTNYPGKIVLPIDVQAATSLEDTNSRIVKINDLLDTEKGLDIGPETVKEFCDILKTAKTVVWNGPLGVYENPKYSVGTEQVLKFLTDNHIDTILGGGDIVAAASQLGYKDKVSHASTGGGATLEYLEGKSLPGLEVIAEK